MAAGRDAAKERTRVALIEAGLELFTEQGLDAPSLDAICDRAGYTRGAFYVHFGSRDDFLVAVMKRVGDPLLDALLAVPDEAGDIPSLPQTAQRFLTALADGSYPLGPAGGVRPHQLLDACARSESIRSLYVELVAEAIRRLARVIDADQTRGQLRQDLPAKSAAELLLAVIIGVQTMLELGVAVDPVASASSWLALLAPLAPSNES